MITSVDYYKLVVSLLVPTKRTPRISRWNQSLVSSTYNEHNILFDYFKQGILTPLWSNSAPYQIGDIVRYGKSTFQNAVENNIIEPTFDNSWVTISDNFIGTDERILFTGEKLTFEYALNKWFDKTFRQPPYQSDIYITTNVKQDSQFFVGNDDSESSFIGIDNSSELITDGFSVGPTFYNMIIHVPNSVLTTLGSNLTNQKNVVRRFADKYVNAGIIYDVVGVAGV